MEKSLLSFGETAADKSRNDIEPPAGGRFFSVSVCVRYSVLLALSTRLRSSRFDKLATSWRVVEMDDKRLRARGDISSLVVVARLCVCLHWQSLAKKSKTQKHELLLVLNLQHHRLCALSSIVVRVRASERAGKQKLESES